MTKDKKRTAAKTKSKHHNVRVAASRGADWLVALREGRQQAKDYPSELALARMRRELRQADLASRLQMSLSTYCAIERGRRPVKLLMARLIAAEVGKPLIQVFYEDENTGKYFVQCDVPLKRQAKIAVKKGRKRVAKATKKGAKNDK